MVEGQHLAVEPQREQRQRVPHPLHRERGLAKRAVLLQGDHADILLAVLHEGQDVPDPDAGPG